MRDALVHLLLAVDRAQANDEKAVAIPAEITLAARIALSSEPLTNATGDSRAMPHRSNGRGPGNASNPPKGLQP